MTSSDILLDERVPQHDGPLGFWFTYESFYNTEPNLRLDHHPKAENLVFVKENGELVFDYDVNIPNIKSYSTRVNSFIILLDESGKIINILIKDIDEMGGLHLGKIFHVHGTTATPMTDGERYFEPSVKLTSKMIEQIDHIEVTNEFEGSGTCR